MIGLAIVLCFIGLVLVILGEVMTGFDPIVRRIKLILGLVAIAAGMVLFLMANPARAEGRPQLSQQGCRVAADMVLVARSLSAAGIERDKAEEVMALVYADVADGGAFDKLRGEIADFAYRRTERPTEVALAFGLMCLQKEGALDGIFGTRLRWSH